MISLYVYYGDKNYIVIHNIDNSQLTFSNYQSSRTRREFSKVTLDPLHSSFIMGNYASMAYIFIIIMIF